jgi:hypothetical protein
MSRAKLVAAREFLQTGQYAVARAILETLPSDPDAQKGLARLDQIAPDIALPDEIIAPQAAEVIPPTTNGSTPHMNTWEYVEVYVKASDKLPSVDFASVLDDQELTTVTHFYTRVLNDYGGQGWELISEEQHGGEVIRLLFKRPKTQS